MSDTPRTDAILISESGGLWDGKRIDAFIAFARNLECMLAEAVGALESVGCKNEWGNYQPCRHLTDANDKNWCPICKALARIKAAKEQI